MELQERAIKKIKKHNAWELGKASSETILGIGYGIDAGKVGYDSCLSFGDEAGPAAFWIENESSIYILDSLNKRINHYVDGKYFNEITLASAFAPQCFSIAPDGTVYICDIYMEERRLLVYYSDGSLASFKLEVRTTRGIDILSGKKISILDWYERKFYNISDGKLQFIGSQALECTEMLGSDYAKYLAEDGDFRYEIQTALVEGSIIRGEIRIIAIDEDGDIAGSVRVPLEEFMYLPNQYAQIDENGMLYFMVPTKRCLEIRKVRLGAMSDSQMEELVASMQEYEMKQASLDVEHTIFAAPSFTREQVDSRANQIIAQKWTLSADNTKTGVEVKLPQYIQKIVDDKLLENGGTVELSGIPYCWGGFDSLYTSNTTGCSNFNEAIAEGCTAGNVYITEDRQKKSKTAGLDCSGFVSAAYGFSSKWSTSNFAKYGKKVERFDDIQSMDFIVKSGEHVVLFYLWPPTGKSTLIIMEAAAGSVGKTVIREVNKDSYLKGYEIRNPW